MSWIIASHQHHEPYAVFLVELRLRGLKVWAYTTIDLRISPTDKVVLGDRLPGSTSTVTHPLFPDVVVDLWVLTGLLSERQPTKLGASIELARV